MRRSGILMPVFSIPSEYGIGTFSKEAYEFVDFLKMAGQKLWQILPLGPTSYGDSPYQSFSTFAGNPYFIDLEQFIKEGFLTKEECEACEFVGHPEYVDYERIYNGRYDVLKKAYTRSNALKTPEYAAFENKNAYWLEDYALFRAIKDAFDGAGWIEWDDDIKLRKPEALSRYKTQLKDEIQFYKFLEFMFDKQWTKLKKYTNDKGIKIVGDLPIYVAFDSADVWSNPELFHLDEENVPVEVAGCPPDAFSQTGQLWGNPLYKWDYHKNTSYKWWMQRIERAYELYDILRIDHFRGFDEYYAIPYGNKTAEIGEWKKGPGYDLFKVMKEKLGEREVIAEDLGFLTESVTKLLEDTGYPGMKILQFAFDWQEDGAYLPHNYDKNCVVYTGTHDNEPASVWMSQLNGHDKDFAMRYMGIKDEAQMVRGLIKLAIASSADTAIIPMQDYLELGKEARINEPSTLGDNWKWRMKKGVCTDKLAEEIRELSSLFARNRF